MIIFPSPRLPTLSHTHFLNIPPSPTFYHHIPFPTLSHTFHPLSHTSTISHHFPFTRTLFHLILHSHTPYQTLPPLTRQPLPTPTTRSLALPPSPNLAYHISPFYHLSTPPQSLPHPLLHPPNTLPSLSHTAPSYIL